MPVSVSRPVGCLRSQARPDGVSGLVQSSGTLTADPEAVTRGGIFARHRDFGRFMHQQMFSFFKDGNISRQTGRGDDTVLYELSEPLSINLDISEVRSQV